jgi:hypothetical protein
MTQTIGFFASLANDKDDGGLTCKLGLIRSQSGLIWSSFNFPFNWTVLEIRFFTKTMMLVLRL